MRSYAKLSPAFWRGLGRRLRGDADGLALAFYLTSCPAAGMTGLFYLALPTMAHDTGLTPERVRAALGRLESLDFVRFDGQTDLVFLVDFVREQVEEVIAETDNRVKSIRRELEEFRGERLLRSWLGRHAKAYHVDIAAFYDPPAPSEPLPAPFEGASKPLETPFEARDLDLGSGSGSRDQEQDQEQLPPARAIPEPPSTALAVVARVPAKRGRPDPGPSAGNVFPEVLRAFTEAWERTYRQAYVVTAPDRSQLGRVLRDFPDATAIRAYPWRRAFENYLADLSKFTGEEKRHSLSWFCTSGGVNKYRTEAATVGMSDREVRGMQSSAKFHELAARFDARRRAAAAAAGVSGG